MRAFYPSRLFRALYAGRWSPESVESLLRREPGDPFVLFLEQVERLNRWAQVGLLDILEDHGNIGTSAKRIRRVVSTVRADIDALVESGEFSHSLFLRLGALHVHVPFGLKKHEPRMMDDRVRI